MLQMSLHLGNLSSRIRRDELERVFRRFGRCNVRVKDKFGFVVYDYPRNAEKALKTLRGKFICGEPISLSWSNKQPRFLQKYTRDVKSFEAVGRTHSAREDYVDHVNRGVGSNGEQGYKESFRQGNGGERLPAEITDEACHENKKDYKEHHPFVDDFPDQGGGVEGNLSKNDNQMNQNVLEDRLEFDRYEPNEADERTEQNVLTHGDGSLSLRKPEEKAGVEQIDPKTQNACYNCGEAGHKMQKCPQGIKRLESRTSRRLRAGRDTISLRMTKGTREAIESRNGHRLRSESSPSARTTHRGGRNNHRENKRCWKEQGSIEKFLPKKARVSISPSNHSNHTSSQSRSSSRSMRSLSQSPSPSRSKLVSSIKDSPFSSSQSGSSTLHTRGKSYKSNMKSRSSSPTSSLSPEKVQKYQKATFVDAGDSQSNGVLFEGEPLENSAARMDDSKLETIIVQVENQGDAAVTELEEDVEHDCCQRRDAIDIGKDSCQWKNSNTTGSDTCDLTTWSASPKSLAETRELQNNDVVEEQTWAQNPNSGSPVAERLHAATLTSLSSEEVYRVLKHYGLENQEKRENELPVETYFGCSRLWPWEIIYYRRLKKGLISTENYSRRLAQNKEFGIVDKFVRSSSGWAELRKENS